MKTALVLLAEGFEEVEALTAADYLRRAGIETTLAGLSGRAVTGSHGIRVEADEVLDADAPLRDCVVVPGGKGAALVAADGAAVALVRRYAAGNRLVAAICAAPALVLGEACGLLEGRAFTCYPGFEGRVPGGRFSAEAVVRDGNLITSRAAGTAGAFAAAVARALLGDAPADTLARSVLLDYVAADGTPGS